MKKAADKIGLKGFLIIDDDKLQDGPWEWNSDLIEPFIISHIRNLSQ